MTETFLSPRHAGDDQALNERGQLLLVLRQQVCDSPTEARRLCVGDEQLALNNTIWIQLAFDADRLVLAERQVTGEMEPFFGDVYDLTKCGGVVFGDQAASRDRHSELSTLRGHDAIRRGSVLRLYKSALFPFSQRSARTAIASTGNGTRLRSIINIKGDMPYLLFRWLSIVLVECNARTRGIPTKKGSSQVIDPRAFPVQLTRVVTIEMIRQVSLLRKWAENSGLLPRISSLFRGIPPLS